MENSPNYKLQICLAPIPIFGLIYVVFYAFWYIKKRKGYLSMFGYYFCLVIPILLLFFIGAILMFKLIHVYITEAWIIVTLDCCVFYVIFLAAAYISVIIEKFYIKKFVQTYTSDQ